MSNMIAEDSITYMIMFRINKNEYELPMTTLKVLEEDTKNGEKAAETIHNDGHKTTLVVPSTPRRLGRGSTLGWGKLSPKVTLSLPNELHRIATLIK